MRNMLFWGVPEWNQNRQILVAQRVQFESVEWFIIVHAKFERRNSKIERSLRILKLEYLFFPGPESY